MIRKLLLSLLGLYSIVAFSSSNDLQYTLHGLKEGPLLNNVEAQLNEALQRLPVQLSDNHIRSWYSRSDQTIRDALAPFGYFNPHIQSQLLQQTDQYHAIYQVSLGPLSKITTLDIEITDEGKHNLNLQRNISTKLPIQLGDTLTTEAYQNTKHLLYEWIISEGYWDAKWKKHSVEVNRDTNTASVSLNLNTGKQYTIGNIHFNSTPLNHAFLNRYLPFQSGDPYRPSTIFNLQENLRNSDYFQTVVVREDKEKQTTPYQMPLDIELTLLPINRYTASFGLSSDIGIRTQLGWLLRRVTESGHRAYFSSQFSKIQNRVSGVYTIPGHQPAIHQYHIQLIYTDKKLRDINTLIRQIGVVSTIKHPTWSRTSFLNYQSEKTLTNTTYILTPGIIWTQKYLHQNLAKPGYKLNIRTQGALEKLFSNTSFLQTEIQGAYLLPIWKKQDHLIFRARFGYTFVTQTDQFPSSLWFYAGGNYSIRGYNYHELGPGHHVLAVSTEYHRYLKENLYLNIFIDAGSVGNHFPLPEIKRGLGIGFIWRSSVGPLEFSLARALDKPTGPWSFVFSFGPDFL